MRTITKQTYQKYKAMVMEYDKHSEEHRTKFKTNCIPFDVYSKFPFAKKVTNKMRSKIETFEFCQNKPERYFLYINEKEKKATTWTGEVLGDVIFMNTYKSNMGDIRRSIIVKSINGLNYYGTFYKSSGDYARIKKLN